ncbi:MAG: 23S rRNA (uracil(1939)-C(5))-methyltransferase RlmD [Vicinamibacterales bacterium]
MSNSSRYAESVDLEIEGLSTSGDGMARLGARRIFIPFTIPGERVRARVPRAPADVTAVLLDVLRPSPHRVVPPCAHFGLRAQSHDGPCGGCAWQHIDYPEQLRLKTALVGRLVQATVPSAPRPAPIATASPLDNPWGYRQKVHFVFGNRTGAPGRALVMGHYARGSRRVIPTMECPVHDPRGNAVAFDLIDRYARVRIAAAGTDSGVLQGVAVRVGCNTPELMATVVVTNGSDRRLRKATQEAVDASAATAFHLNFHPKDDGFVFGGETRRLSGSDRMRERVAGASFLISPTAFFQTNVHAAQLLVSLVLQAVPERSRVLDLYAGAGLFAIPLARAGHRVTAIEENREAIADGEASARLNRLDPSRCRFISRRVELALSKVPAIDAVVLDPPRDGCAPGVLDAVFGRIRPRIGVYVSCNPEVLATDLRVITGHGYAIQSIQPVDMFPHTAHVEALAVVTR